MAKNIAIILVVLIIGITFIYMVTHHVSIKLNTFFKKGYKPYQDKFGCYVYVAPQGKGKTTALVAYLYDHKAEDIVFSNIKNIRDIPYTPFTGFKGIYEIIDKLDRGELVIPNDKQLVIVYDELFSELQRQSKIDDKLMDFLTQMRKRKIIFLTTCQLWREVPLTLRKIARYQIECKLFVLFNRAILIKVFHNAEEIMWDETQQDFVSPIMETVIEKGRKEIVDLYNTYERIHKTDVLGHEKPKDDASNY